MIGHHPTGQRLESGSAAPGNVLQDRLAKALGTTAAEFGHWRMRADGKPDSQIARVMRLSRPTNYQVLRSKEVDSPE
jgi:hypothetical protein